MQHLQSTSNKIKVLQLADGLKILSFFCLTAFRAHVEPFIYLVQITKSENRNEALALANNTKETESKKIY